MLSEQEEKVIIDKINKLKKEFKKHGGTSL